ncbi:nitrilase-related carbon-nitrogen hydrolase [Hyperthermus butylicus]|uniref:Amidohydrolase n=1 Tax=Hyperthermus butylicus (strain DSM 5456 / JCM 9403 / PLM1-5) TaxID=415426 RepID=A2BKF1_HYPBU|nr:nitrilase-related carbon-nitrogen hydrolase [Hyperthermus butylicus]ABM80462.1 putative amidohydrolase [Hyperthermus butylicus DSM 5456]
MARVRLGLAQFEAGRSGIESGERLRRLLSRYRVEADIIVLPEYGNVYPAGLRAAEVRARAENPKDSPFIRFLEEISSEYTAVIVSGFLERSGDCAYSSIVMVEPGKEVQVVYRKTVLFDALGVRESKSLCRGEQPPPVLEVRGVRVGFIVCFELRFPELARSLALRGAELVAVPAAWYRGNLKEEHLLVTARSRALENTVYLAVASMTGPHFTGRSILVDPMGVVRLDLGSEPGYAEVDVDLDYINEVRKQLPLLELQPRAYEIYTRALRRD